MGVERMVSLIFSYNSSCTNSLFLVRIPDLQLCPHHPKRNFIRRAIEVEVRLAYHERIMKTLPEPYLSSDAGVTPDQAPGPEFDYDDPGMIYSFFCESSTTVLMSSHSEAAP